MKIAVIRVNYTEDTSGGLFGFGKLCGVDMSKLPPEQEIWIDTKHITRIDSILPDEINSGAFNVKMDDSENPIAVKASCYEYLLNTWKGEE